MTTLEESCLYYPENTTEPGDSGWDELGKLHLECRAVSVSPTQVLMLLKDPQKLQLVKDPLALVNQAKVLSNDVRLYNERLASIHSKHAGRQGNSESPDQLMEILGIGEEYQEWLMSYGTVVTPMVISILELFQADALEGEYIPAERGAAS